jgi:hypothetical protein
MYIENKRSFLQVHSFLLCLLGTFLLIYGSIYGSGVVKYNRFTHEKCCVNKRVISSIEYINGNKNVTVVQQIRSLTTDRVWNLCYSSILSVYPEKFMDDSNCQCISIKRSSKSGRFYADYSCDERSLIDSFDYASKFEPNVTQFDCYIQPPGDAEICLGTQSCEYYNSYALEITTIVLGSITLLIIILIVLISIDIEYKFVEKIHVAKLSHEYT